MKDSDIARQVAGDSDLDVGTIDETKTTHDHVAQVAQTDWEFLTQRAREIGYETGVTGGEFFFRKASGSPSGGGLGGFRQHAYRYSSAGRRAAFDADPRAR